MQIVHTWIETLTHLYALADQAPAAARDPAALPPSVEETSSDAETFIDPRKATLSGYLASHLNYAGEPVDLFRNESGHVCLVTHHHDGSMTVDGERYARVVNAHSPEQPLVEAERCAA